MQKSIIIPAFNEQRGIGVILEELEPLASAYEIIVVDDGSTDNTLGEVQKYPFVKLIRLPENRGKTWAVYAGIERARGEIIVLIDADLVNFNYKFIHMLVAPLEDNRAEMTILKKEGDNFFHRRIAKLTPATSGERAFFKKDFLKIAIPRQSGFFLELLINQHYLKNKKRIEIIPAQRLKGVLKYQKYGWVGAFYDLKVVLSFGAKFGPLYFFRHCYLMAALENNNHRGILNNKNAKSDIL